MSDAKSAGAGAPANGTGVTEFEFQGPKRGADRAVLLAHGAGADMHAATLTAFTGALADAKIPSLRFNFPYRTAGRSSTDRPAVAIAAVRQAATELARRTKLPVERIVVGGRSFGGRMASLAITQDDPLKVLGLALLAYPLHAPGKRDQGRTEHFPSIRVPTLFVEGTRDAFGSPDELRAAAKLVKGKVAWHWIETADHGFRPLKRETGLTTDDVLQVASSAFADWVARL
jgi:predicted alpha/beta-hydrolase family hydrolase